MKPLIVTRHPGLAKWLGANGYLPKEGAEVVTHVTPDDVRGRNVVGVLPLRLAVLANTVTEVPMDIPEGMRGAELTAEQVEEFRSGPPVTYTVTGIIQTRHEERRDMSSWAEQQDRQRRLERM